MIEPHCEVGLLARFDDVRGLDARLDLAWTVLEEYGVPAHLEVVPGWLDSSGAESIARRARCSRVPVEVHQHGARHDNHGDDKHRFEFDDDRDLDEQFDAIRTGRAVLEHHLGDWFRPIFSPPWNRYGSSTVHALARAGFVAFSCLDRPGITNRTAVVHIPMTADPVRWRPEPKYEAWEETQAALFAALETAGIAGLELHHEHLTDEDIEGLDRILREMARRGVRRPSMSAVAEEMSR